LIANVVHISLNARGGGERLAVATIKALSSMGIQVELVTNEKPDMNLIHDAYGSSIEHDVKKVRTLSLFQNAGKGITVNTHGDMLPFFRRDFTRKNSVVYCHYPIALHLIECGDSDYARVLRNTCLSTMTEKGYRLYLKAAKDAYTNMMVSSTILTNSEFSKRTILRIFGVNSMVIHPPVDTDIFRNAALSSNVRDNSILVVSRFHPSKKIENAIHLARLLRQNEVASGIIIAGNMSPEGIGYCDYLRQLVRHYDLEDFVRFEVNIRFDRLLYLMRTAKVYVHPLPGEPFGISTVEAMSAGLIPVVPDIGGHTEFVPVKYQFHTFGQGLDAVARALDAPASERIQISHSTQKYSTSNFVKKFQQVMTEVLDIEPIAGSMPVISVKRFSEPTAA
jgi:glycosyltransferase involved in cell wall biosynthesis